MVNPQEIIHHLVEKWSIYLPIFLSVTSIYLEHYLHIIPRLKKMWTFGLNKRAWVQLTLRYPLRGDFDSAKEQFIKTLRAKGQVIVHRNTGTKLSVTSRGFSLTLTRSASVVQVELLQYSAPIRAIRGDVLGLLAELEMMTQAEGHLISPFGSVEDAEVTVDLPYEWEAIRFAKLRKWNVGSYRVELFHESQDCRVDISLKKVNIQSRSQNALGLVLADVI